ncbi:hypothetical protein TNCV_681151 [Trichonephila clavipes]|nr:hypothetical protein TNCV_681151 [Trichonephila clavipes]
MTLIDILRLSNRRQYEQLGLDLQDFGRSDMVVARCWQQWITEGECTVAEGQDCHQEKPLFRRNPNHRQCRNLGHIESRFLSADDHRTRVWRSGIYCRAAYSNKNWEAISWDTRSSLVVLQGTLTARRYVDDILNCATHAINGPV